MFNIGISISPNKSVFGPLLFSGDLNKGLENASSLGYDGVELSLLDSQDLDQVWLLDRLKDLGLSVYAIATGQTYYTDGYSLFDFEENKRNKSVGRIKGHIDLASELGSKVIIGGIRGKITEKGESRSEQENEGKKAIRECVRYAESKRVILLIEPINRYETNIINTLEEGIRLIKEIGSENLKLLPDTFHMNIEEVSIEESLFKAKQYMGYIHFADSNRLAPGFGHLDFEKILSVLRKINYKGTIGIEILPKPDDYKAGEKAISYLRNLEIKI
ncbi:MAG: sugar phosphate isomerase/epimerase [Actinomycetia bacterium]|nr:sugar phosphate isomerase/epimerase [Actinomycetes bacterium]